MAKETKGKGKQQNGEERREKRKEGKQEKE